MHVIDIKSATTGLAWLAGVNMKPGMGICEAAASDVIDAPNWVPTGSHRRQDEESYSIVYGETLRGEL